MLVLVFAHTVCSHACFYLGFVTLNHHTSVPRQRELHPIAAPTRRCNLHASNDRFCGSRVFVATDTAAGK